MHVSRAKQKTHRPTTRNSIYLFLVQTKCFYMLFSLFPINPFALPCNAIIPSTPHIIHRVLRTVSPLSVYSLSMWHIQWHTQTLHDKREVCACVCVCAPDKNKTPVNMMALYCISGDRVRLFRGLNVHNIKNINLQATVKRSTNNNNNDKKCLYLLCSLVFSAGFGRSKMQHVSNTPNTNRETGQSQFIYTLFGDTIQNQFGGRQTWA